MELKLPLYDAASSVDNRSNRTFMELKFISAIEKFIDTKGSNRTFMELKCVYANA